LPAATDAFDALERTHAFWREWSDRCPEVGPWTEAVKRSLITLKALTYAPTGGIVAVLRYEAGNPGDGLPPGEGAFLACSFWLVDNYVLQGRFAEARKLFDCLLSRCNDVGLLAEEFDPLTGRMLGNFPQAYSHVGLINSALSLSREMGPAEERAEPQ
jgi:GH15 family glucan-1,4-alpha-glucosidase